MYQKGVHCRSIKIFNSLPSNIKNISNNQKKLKTTLKMCYIQIFFIHLMNILMLIKERM
jgi:hypothetical protein